MPAPNSIRFKAALLAALVFVLSVPIVGAVVLVLVLFLAGPHSEAFPRAVQALVLVLGWVAVIAVPL